MANKMLTVKEFMQCIADEFNAHFGNYDYLFRCPACGRRRVRRHEIDKIEYCMFFDCQHSTEF